MNIRTIGVYVAGLGLCSLLLIGFVALNSPSMDPPLSASTFHPMSQADSNHVLERAVAMQQAHRAAVTAQFVAEVNDLNCVG